MDQNKVKKVDWVQAESRPNLETMRWDPTHIARLLDGIYPEWRDLPDMKRTPQRVMMMYHELLTPQVYDFTVFKNTERYDQIVLQKDIPFYSLCAHHLLPFIGKAHVAYIPKKYYVGLSKLSRLVNAQSRVLGTQEGITQAIGEELELRLKPLGAAVVIEAQHMCMTMRGAEVDGVNTTTSYMGGAFRKKAEARAELMSMIYGGK